jgi:hypothetical protein
LSGVGASGTIGTPVPPVAGQRVSTGLIWQASMRFANYVVPETTPPIGVLSARGYEGPPGLDAVVVNGAVAVEVAADVHDVVVLGDDLAVAVEVLGSVPAGVGRALSRL